MIVHQQLLEHHCKVLLVISCVYLHLLLFHSEHRQQLFLMISPTIDLFRESRKLKREVAEKRYLSFYIPFLTICAKLSIDYSDQYISKKTQNELLQLLLDNLEYLDKRTIKYILKFCFAHTDMNDPSANRQLTYDIWLETFQSITRSATIESRKLSKFLKFEDITSITRINWQ